MIYIYIFSVISNQIRIKTYKVYSLVRVTHDMMLSYFLKSFIYYNIDTKILA